MSNGKDPLDLLRQAYKHADVTGQPLIKEAAGRVESLIEQLNEAIEVAQVMRSSAQWLEAPASVNFRMAHPGTLIEAQFTLRDFDEVALGTRMTRLVESLSGNGYCPFDAYVDKRRGERGEVSSLAVGPAFTQAPPQTAGGHGGTSRLLKIVVASPGKAEFHCDGMQYPMKDSRGAKTLVSLFDPDLPFAETDFATEAIYTPANKWNNTNLMVDWEGVEKDGRKYRNILRVHS